MSKVGGTMETKDIILELRTKNGLSRDEVAKKYSSLTRWSVVGKTVAIRSLLFIRNADVTDSIVT